MFYVEAYLFIYAKREVKKLRERHQKKYSTLRQISVILWKVISKAKPLHAERLDRDTYFTRVCRVLQRLGDESLDTHAGEEKRHIDRDDCLYLIEDDLLRVIKTGSEDLQQAVHTI